MLHARDGNKHTKNVGKFSCLIIYQFDLNSDNPQIIKDIR